MLFFQILFLIFCLAHKVCLLLYIDFQAFYAGVYQFDDFE